MPYSILPKAEADLIQAWSFSYRKWGRAQADSYLALLHEAFKTIAERPGLGISYDYRPNYRRWEAGAHMIYYRLTNDVIEIVRVLHHKMNRMKHLKE